jgi:acyl-CoA synthetase (AMP-forming)/AMP-acid ligase II
MIMADGVCLGNSAIEDVRGKMMTYRQLQDHVNRFVGGLNGVGFRRNDRIAIVMPNGPEIAVTLVSVACGFTAILLNPNYTTPEFEQYLSKIKVKALLVERGSRSPSMEVAKSLGLELFELAPRGGGEEGPFARAALDSHGKEEPDFAKPEDIAFVLLTSGTTALPKRIPLTHMNLCWGVYCFNKHSGMTGADRNLIIFPFFHSGGMFTLFKSLNTKGTAICTPGFRPSEFFEWLDRTHPTTYTGTPTMFQIIVAMAKDHREVVSRSKLKWMVTGAAAMPYKLMRELEGTFGVPVIETYVASEGMVGVSPLPPLVRKHAAVIPCIDVAIIDELGNVVPTGTLGEITVRGPNISKGYEDDPETNELAFFNGWFKTGDLGYMDGDGYLHLSGRVKEIINKGGEKIAPFEIDETLLKHPAVAEAVAFPVPHPSLGEDVNVAVVLSKGQTASEDELRMYLFDRLAHFKVPTRILILPEIPKGPSGKVKRFEMAQALGLGHK